jgi:hypothetical protein
MNLPPEVPQICRLCRAIISASARFCEKCGAPVATSSIPENPQRNKASTKTGLLGPALLVATGIVALLFLLSGKWTAKFSALPPGSPSPVTKAETEPTEAKAEYERRILAEQRAKDRAKQTPAPDYDASIDPATVTYTPHKWELPIVRSVLIPTKFATEAGMIAVARRIDRDALDYQSIDVEIFDNEKAERLSKVEGWRRDLTKSESAFCKLHTLGVYRRNRGVNINELSLYDNEGTGKVIKGDVRKIIRLTEGEPTGGMLSNAIEERRKRPTAQLQWDGTSVRTEDAKQNNTNGEHRADKRVRP